MISVIHTLVVYKKTKLKIVQPSFHNCTESIMKISNAYIG